MGSLLEQAMESLHCYRLQCRYWLYGGKYSKAFLGGISATGLLV